MRNDIIKWNLDRPWDRVWRKKYKVAYGSPEHLDVTSIDQVTDLYEDRIFKEITDKRKAQQNNLVKWHEKTHVFRDIQLEQDQIEELFDNLDLSQYQIPK